MLGRASASARQIRFRRVSIAVDDLDPSALLPSGMMKFCARLSGSPGWHCTKPKRPQLDHVKNLFVLNFTVAEARDATVEMTTEQLVRPGIDGRVDVGSTLLSESIGMHHDHLVPGTVLFDRGVVFRDLQPPLSDVNFAFAAAGAP